MAGSAKYPNEFGGWGLVDLRKAMNGPAQLLGRGDFNLPSGQKDTWTNDISQEAIVQRKGGSGRGRWLAGQEGEHAWRVSGR